MQVTDGVENNTQENLNAEQTAKTNEVEETTEKTKDKAETSEEIKTYTDEEVNAISLKNSDKAVKKLMAELGIENIDEAKAILTKAKEEKAEEVDEEKNSLREEAKKAKVNAMNLKIENSLLLRGVNSSKASRIKGLINKSDILDDKGELDEDKLNTEIEELFKTFPEFKTKNETNSGFVLGSDGKEDKKEDPMRKMRNIMGLK